MSSSHFLCSFTLSNNHTPKVTSINHSFWMLFILSCLTDWVSECEGIQNPAEVFHPWFQWAYANKIMCEMTNCRFTQLSAQTTYINIRIPTCHRQMNSKETWFKPCHEHYGTSIWVTVWLRFTCTEQTNTLGTSWILLSNLLWNQLEFVLWTLTLNAAAKVRPLHLPLFHSWAREKSENADTV